MQQDSKKVLFLFLAVSSASFSWIWPSVKFFLNNIQWDRCTTTLASILGLYLLCMFGLVRRSEFKTQWLTCVVLPTSVLIMHRFISLPSVLNNTAFYGRLWFSIIVLTIAMQPIRPTSDWYSRTFILIRWAIYIILSVPVAVGCYYSSDNWSWIPSVATCVFIELFILSSSGSNTPKETSEGDTPKEKQTTNYYEIAPFVLTLTVLLLFTCVSRITLAPVNSKAAPEWTFDEFHERFETNELTDRMIYSNATRIRAGLISDTSRTRPDYKRSPLIFWFYDEIIGIPSLTRLLRPTYPKTKQAAVQLYNTFFDDPMSQDLFESNGQNYPVAITQRTISIANLSAEAGSAEIHETYSTINGWQPEVVYFFSLPENCVLTGVWLQESLMNVKANKLQGHKYVVSPRGAAQRVYDKLKERRVDPALLEQVGPVQYRLKIYPIPGNSNVMHMWMTYEFMKTQDGEVPMPKLLRVEGAKLQSLKKTTVIFNGNQTTYNSAADEVDSWMPELTIKLPRDKDAQSCTMKINNERVVVASDDKKLFDPETVTVAVVVDASYSMRVYENSVLEAVTQLQQKFDIVDVFSARRRVTQCTMSECLPDPTSFSKLKLPLKKKDIIFLGSTNYDDLVLSKAHLNATYDITILLTDEATIDPYYTRSEKHQGPSRGDFWMVHLNRKYPNKFQDFATEALFINDARVALSVDDVIARYVPGRDSLHETDMKPCNESLSKFVAKKYMQKYLRENRPHVDEEGEAVNPLERVHEVAIKHSIVTPYSSMIVLINRVQKDMLEIEEDKDNKFERKNEVDERYSSWQWNSLFSSAPSQFQAAIPTLIFMLIVSLTVLFYGIN